jgi:hypothetical protein
MISKKVLAMKYKESLWIKNTFQSTLLKKYFFDVGEKLNIDFTYNPEEARTFNWFTYGFLEFILNSFGIFVRESYILKMKKGKF